MRDHSSGNRQRTALGALWAVSIPCSGNARANAISLAWIHAKTSSTALIDLPSASWGSEKFG